MLIPSKSAPYFRGYYQFVGKKVTPARVIQSLTQNNNHVVLDVCRNLMLQADVKQSSIRMGQSIPDITCVLPFKNLLLGISGNQALKFMRFIDKAYEVPQLESAFKQSSPTKPDYVMDEVDEETLKDIEYYFQKKKLNPKKFIALDMDA